MVELPDIVYGLVRMGAYARMASEGGIYCSVCIRLAFRVWIPWTLRVGKVGVKVGFKWPSSAGLMLQDLALLALWVQVQDKSRVGHGKTIKISLSVLHCSAKPAHLPNAHQEDTTPATTIKARSAP